MELIVPLMLVPMSLLLLVTQLPASQAKIQVEPQIPTVPAYSVVGASAELPCDVNPPSSDDRILLILWYREGLGKPIYSFDARKHPLRDGHHWSDPEVLGTRSHFLLGVGNDLTSRLILNDVRHSDQGLYRCRVDFKLSPTRNARVNLTIAVPPETPLIYDEHGKPVTSTVGPYNEGGILILTCEASGGIPLPKVTWWRENRLLDATSENVVQGRVSNTLRIPNLSRSDLSMTLTCQASNNNMSVPTSAVVVIDMKLRPLGIKLEGENQPLSADRKYELTCISWGARPAGMITWWKGSTRLQSSRQTVSADGNMTTSILTYVPSVDDQSKVLSCRVEHALLLHNTLEQGWKLSIQYVPIAHLELGSSLRLDNIKEGDDVYFECNVKAFPWISRVLWRHNGKQIHPNVTHGIIVHNQTLVLQRIDRRWSGLLTCVASNEEGDGESNALPLHIKFLPVCKTGQVTTYYVARGELIQIPCEVEAYPTDLVFQWTFNGSRDFADIPGSHYVADRLKSSLSYRPLTEQDYGTLMCWARNLVGEQRQPCIFQIVPAGKPDSVSNCSCINTTSDSVEIACAPGYDGGLPQQFFIEVADSSGRLVGNRTSHVASFPIRGLEMGRNYEITIWAANTKGRSEPQVVHVSTTRPTEKEKRTEPVVASNAAAPVSSVAPPVQPLPLHLTPVLGSLIGVGSAMILAAAIIVLIMRVRHHEHSRRRSGAEASYDKASVPLHTDADDSFDLRQKKTRISQEEDNRDEEERAFDKILSMSTNKRILMAPQKTATLKPSNDVMYAELSLAAQNGLVQTANAKRSADPTIYAQIDHANRISTANPNSGVTMGVSTVPAPPSGYVRLPPVDQYQLIPYADNSSPSPSPSQYSASTQQVRWSRGEPETISVDSRETDRAASGGRSSSAEATVISGNISSLPLINVQSTSEVQLSVPLSASGWLTPVGTTRL